MPDVYFFGVWDKNRLGHYLHGEHGLLYDREREAAERMLTKIWPAQDGTLCPGTGNAQVQGAAKIHQKGGWTAIGFWDRSGDKRGNSNAVFFMKGIGDSALPSFTSVMQAAKARYPQLFERFDFEIELAETCNGEDCVACNPKP